MPVGSMFSSLSSDVDSSAPMALRMVPSEPLLLRPTQAVDSFARVPPCAVPCFSEHCTLQNITCVCGPDKREINRCIFISCDLHKAICIDPKKYTSKQDQTNKNTWPTVTRNVTESTCQTPVRNRSAKFNVMIISMTAFTVPIVVLRLLFKQFFSAQKRLNSEDWTIMAALPLGLPSVALTIFGLTAHGLGKDIWGLELGEVMEFGRYFYVIQILYIMLMALVKLTLTFFYITIFTGLIIKRLLWATAAVHSAAALAFAIGIVFQCTPVAYQWEKYNYSTDRSVPGSCININAAGWANGAISVVSDIWLLAIPLSQIHKLRLHWKKKLGATLMFMTGAIVTIVSFLRLASIRKYASTSNPTWDQWDIVWWSTIEVEVGLICTCLPAMRLILVRISPRIFGSGPPSAGMPLNRISTVGHTQLIEYDEPVRGKLLRTTRSTT